MTLLNERRHIAKEHPNEALLIKIVENTIKKSRDYPTATQLWQRLSKKLEYATFCRILKKLENEDKILYDKDSSIIWVYPDNLRIKRMLRESVPASVVAKELVIFLVWHYI